MSASKILSVDDSAIIRRIVSNVTDMLGYEFLEAGNGQEGLEVLQANVEDIALVLLDWNMPVMDGHAALKAIKDDPRYKDIPVMMLTTEGARDNIVEAIRAGAKQYLTKPFTPEDLSTKILQCVECEFE
jgi:two-component system chemotaxis response regulator CheY